MEHLKESERQTAQKVVAAMLTAGYQISVNDGEENVLLRSVDEAAILKAMGSTEEDWLWIHDPQQPKQMVFGWVRFVWGNEDWVAICDHTLNLGKLLEPVMQWMDGQECEAIARQLLDEVQLSRPIRLL